MTPSFLSPSLRHSHPNGSIPWVIDKSSHASAYGRMPQEFLRRNHGRLPVLTCSSPCFACRLATEVFAPGPGELVPHQDGYATNAVRNNVA
jgi:hypothetical protein